MKTRLLSFSTSAFLLCLLPTSLLAQPKPIVVTHNYLVPMSQYDWVRGWNGYVGLDYQQFSNNGTTFAQSSSGTRFNVSPDYHTGYNLGLGYRIPGRDNTTINLDYMHLNTSDSSNASASSLTLSPEGSTPVTSANGKVEFSYDSVNLTIGHRIQVSPRFDIGYYGGVNYTYLAKDMNINGDGLGNFIHNAVGTSYRGFGPTFGIDGYCVPFDQYPNVSIFGGVNPSLLYGTMSGYVRTSINDVGSMDTIPNDKTVIPGLSGKLGLNYDFPFQGTKLNLQLGYQITEYFGVARDAENYSTTINASFQGLFLNLGAGF